MVSSHQLLRPDPQRLERLVRIIRMDAYIEGSYSLGILGRGPAERQALPQITRQPTIGIALGHGCSIQKTTLPHWPSRISAMPLSYSSNERRCVMAGAISSRPEASSSRMVSQVSYSRRP